VFPDTPRLFNTGMSDLHAITLAIDSDGANLKSRIAKTPPEPQQSTLWTSSKRIQRSSQRTSCSRSARKAITSTMPQAWKSFACSALAEQQECGSEYNLHLADKNARNILLDVRPLLSHYRPSALHFSGKILSVSPLGLSLRRAATYLKFPHSLSTLDSH